MTHPDSDRLVGGDWITRDGDDVRLTLTACRACGAQWFPPRDTCSACASDDVATVSSPHEGTVYASTMVRIGPAAFDPPYPLAYVDIGPVRVLTHLRTKDAVPPGTPVRLAVDRIGDGIRSYVATPEVTR